MQTTHMATPVLEVAHLEKVYGALGNVTRALNDVSFTVNRGEFVGIMGASGSGKSTLLNCVSTIDKRHERHDPHQRAERNTHEAG